MSQDISDLDLSGNEARAARGGLLKPGRHLCRTSDAKAKACSGGMQLEVSLTEVNGIGAIKDFIIYHHTNAEAVRIGRDKILAMLTFGGHRSPKKPGPVASYNGLIVGVTVIPDDSEYTDSKGVKRKRGSEVQGFFDPKELGVSTVGTGSRSTAPDDEIPF